MSHSERANKMKGRPTTDHRWPAFSAVLIAAGFGRKLLESDSEWSHHFGPELWALFVGGVEFGSIVRRLAAQRDLNRPWQVALYHRRRAAGLCVRCAEPSGEMSKCEACLERQRRHARSYWERLKRRIA